MKSPSSAGAPKPNSATILAVDDEPDVLYAIRAVFKEALPGVRVVTALSGAEALRHVEAKPFNLIVADYRMPGMDGIEFLSKARKLRPDLRSILITAYPDPEVASRATREGGASLVVAKPFDLEVLVGVVEFLLRSSSGVRRAE